MRILIKIEKRDYEGTLRLEENVDLQLTEQDCDTFGEYPDGVELRKSMFNYLKLLFDRETERLNQPEEEE